MENCIIEELLKEPFGRRNFIEKQQIIEKGRPMPTLTKLKTHHQDKRKSFMRHFHARIYDKIPWLCGSVSIEKLFCWPCILFSSESTVWNKQGFENLNSLSVAVQKHARSQNHIKCFVQIQSFGKIHVDLELNEELKRTVKQHNEMVKNNRDVLKRLIDTVCYLAKVELPFRGHDKSNNSLNRGVCMEALNLLSVYDPILRSHLNSATIFRGTSKRIQNNLIEAISILILNKIKNEIMSSEFVAILLDETSDVMNLSQLSTVLRYVTTDGQVHEHFIGFSDVSTDKTAQGLFNHVIKIVEEYKIKDKLISQTYDGATVMTGQMNELCTEVLQECPNAIFVHRFAHSLNLILQQLFMNIAKCKIFFSFLSGLAEFFSKSLKQSTELKIFMEQNLPRVAPRWNFSSRLVNTVCEYLQEIIDFFESLIQNSDFWDEDTIVKAQSFRSFLVNIDNCFLLVVFSRLFSYTDVLYETIQTKSFDIHFCYKKFQDTQKLIYEEKTKFDEIWEEFTLKRHVCDLNEIPTDFKRKHPESFSYQDICRQLFYEIIDTMIVQLSNRFESLKELVFLELVDPSKFSEYKKDFPDNAFKKVQENYHNIFDVVRLKNELIVVYGWDDFQGKDPYESVTYMNSFDLNKGMPETYKLNCLYLTLPSSTASVERSISALKRIKSYTKGTQGQSKMSNLALLSIEKSVLCELQKNDNFYTEVIEEFCKRDGRIEFIYK